MTKEKDGMTLPRSKQEGGGGLRTKRLGVTVYYPPLDEDKYSNVPWDGADSRIARQYAMTGEHTCKTCGAHCSPEYAWRFVGLGEADYYCGKHAPAAQEKAKRVLHYQGSLAALRNQLARLLPRSLRLGTSSGAVDVAAAAVELIRDALADTAEEAGDRLVMVLHSALSAASWENIPKEEGYSDERLSARVSLENWLLEVINHD